MSSGFVPAGLGEIETRNDDDWLRAQKVIEASRTQKYEEGKQEGGKSLYEVLQQNKTTKQEAFEESIRLKNQFRTLDDDEVDFLDNVLESTRAKEQQVKKETEEQLEAFRRLREAAEKALVEETASTEIGTKSANSPVEGESWTTSSRKRRRTKGNEDGFTTKLRRKSSPVTKAVQAKPPPSSSKPSSATSRGPVPATANQKNGDSLDRSGPKPGKADVSSRTALDLGAYSSDDD